MIYDRVDQLTRGQRHSYESDTGLEKNPHIMETCGVIMPECIDIDLLMFHIKRRLQTSNACAKKKTKNTHTQTKGDRSTRRRESIGGKQCAGFDVV